MSLRRRLAAAYLVVTPMNQFLQLYGHNIHSATGDAVLNTALISNQWHNDYEQQRIYTVGRRFAGLGCLKLLCVVVHHGSVKPHSTNFTGVVGDGHNTVTTSGAQGEGQRCGALGPDSRSVTPPPRPIAGACAVPLAKP